MQNILSILSELAFLLAMATLYVFPRVERKMSVQMVKVLSWSAAGFFLVSFSMELVVQILDKANKKKKSVVKV